MATYKTSLGKSIDMSALAAKNERVRAVSNAKLNARGDIIDSHGKIVQPVTSRVNKNYANTVGNRSANAVKKVPRKGDDVVRNTRTPQNGVNQRVDDFELTAAEKELEQDLQDDIEVEQIKSKEINGGNKTDVRRSQD
jgi:hypothetical protein